MIDYSTALCEDARHYFEDNVMFNQSKITGKWEGWTVSEETKEQWCSEEYAACTLREFHDDGNQLHLVCVTKREGSPIPHSKWVDCDSVLFGEDKAWNLGTGELGYYLIPATSDSRDRLIEIVCNAPRRRIKGFSWQRHQLAAPLTSPSVPSEIIDRISSYHHDFYAHHTVNDILTAYLYRLNNPLHPSQWKDKLTRLLTKPSHEVVVLDNYLAVIKDRRNHVGYVLLHGVYVSDVTMDKGTLSIKPFITEGKDSPLSLHINSLFNNQLNTKEVIYATDNK